LAVDFGSWASLLAFASVRVAAADLAGIPPVLFLTRLADYGIDTFRFTRQEVEPETRLV
jgi:hypothetical protein